VSRIGVAGVAAWPDVMSWDALGRSGHQAVVLSRARAGSRRLALASEVLLQRPGAVITPTTSG
jgi:hypothetical protein